MDATYADVIYKSIPFQYTDATNSRESANKEKEKKI